MKVRRSYTLIRICIGKSGLILTYGSSGKEKENTILGNAANAGLFSRSMKALLDIRARVLRGVEENSRMMILKETSEKSASMKNQSESAGDHLLTINGEKVLDFKIFVEAYEIYNEEINDLLKKDKSAASTSKQKLQIKEKDNQRVFIKGRFLLTYILIELTRFNYN